MLFYIHSWFNIIMFIFAFIQIAKNRRVFENKKPSFWMIMSFFIKYHIDLRSCDEIINHWICISFDDKRYYRYSIDNKLLFINLMIDFLFWSLERLLSFDFENDFLFEFIEFMINLLNDHLEHLWCSELLIVFPKNSMNVLKKNQSLESLRSFSFDINILNFKYLLWYSIVNSVWWWLTKYFFNENIINSIFFNQSRFNVSIDYFSRFKQKDENQYFSHHIRSFFLDSESL